jgi:hypothetical protein
MDGNGYGNSAINGDGDGSHGNSSVLTNGDWSPEDLGEQTKSEKKIRRVRRSLSDTPTT